jgi:hypothetical protein
MIRRCVCISAAFFFAWLLHVLIPTFWVESAFAQEGPTTSEESSGQGPLSRPESRKGEAPQSTAQQEPQTHPLREEGTSTTGEQKATKKAQEENRQKEAEESKRLTELFLRQQSVFIHKGELMIEFDPTYSRNSRTELIRAGTSVLVANVTRRFFDSTIIARYGLFTDGLELDIIAPVFVHAEQITDFGGGLTSTVEEEGFGDLAAAIRYQVWYEKGSRPSLILDAEGKSRTGGTGLKGTGTWNAGGGITLLKTIDPVVFFGRVGYTYNFASHDRDLGNIIDYRFGMGFSLNDRVSFNMQLTGALIEPSQIATVSLIGGGGGGVGPVVLSTRRVEIMNLVFTTTVLVTKKLFLEPFAGAGLTEHSFTIIGLRVPYRF